MAATNKIVAEWLPREDLPTPRTLTCSVLDTRHRGRVVFFAGVRDEASQQTIQLIFRGSSTPGGGMADDELRWLKRRLRPGDQIRAEIFATERATDESVATLNHVRHASLLSMSLRSNTGREHTRELEETEQSFSTPADNGDGEDGDEREDEAAPDDGDELAGSSDAHAGGEARRQERARIFVEWILATFSNVRSGDVGSVLDVAGGRGELCFHLTLEGVRCTLVDPRPSSGYLSKWQRKRMRRSGQPAFEVAHEFFGEAGGEASAAMAREASLIIGMHPDEVTETIVDTALAAGTPFAVVPCCVFSRLFPFRTLPNSKTLVTTHGDFCRYLKAKDPKNIKLATLGFAGKNVVVYSLGEPRRKQDEEDEHEPSAEVECVPCVEEEPA